LRQDLEIRDNLRTNFHQPELTSPVERKKPARAAKP